MDLAFEKVMESSGDKDRGFLGISIVRGFYIVS